MYTILRTDKPWGYEKLLCSKKYLFKELFMKKDCQCSLQYHENKQETIYVLDGILKIILIEDNGPKEYILHYGDTMTIEPGTIHRMYGQTDCLYLEVSTCHPDDVIRIEDDYGRA